MAPEVVHGHNYGLPADLWSLGVMLYEMICGQFPFGDKLSDPMKVYEAISRGRLYYPEHIKYLELESKGVLSLLLNVAPPARGTVDGLKRHIWFRGFDWNALRNYRLTSPYKPATDSDYQHPPSSHISLQQMLSEHSVPSRKGSEIESSKEPFGWDFGF
jgi:serine/threonine protein kinase